MADNTEQRLDLNIYITSEVKERLEEILIREKRKRGDTYFPKCPPMKSILEYVMEELLPLFMPVTTYWSNTNQKTSECYLTFRPEITMRNRNILPESDSLAFSGIVTPQNIRIQNISIVPRSPCRSFEVQKRVAINYVGNWINSASNNHQIERSIFTQDFVNSLVPLSEKTRDSLKTWRDCLEWQKNLLDSGIIGIRYHSFDKITDPQHRPLIQFNVVAENKEEYDKVVKNFVKYGKEFSVYELKISDNEWHFNLQNEFSESGNFTGAAVSLERRFKLEKTDKQIINVPFEKPCFGSFSFYIAESDKENIEEYKDGDYSDYINSIPKDGFIAISSTGERILLKRLTDNLDNIEKKAITENPYLLEYLFDISHVLEPSEIISKSIVEWQNDRLNEDQKNAVCKMLCAPELAFIQGPPGTGKTTMIAEAICQFIRQGKKVLLSSQANMAIDNALERLPHTSLVRPIRIVNNVNKTNTSENASSSPFAPENAITTYYNNIANECEQLYLKTWEDLDDAIQGINRWIDEAERMWEQYNLCHDIFKTKNREVSESEVKINMVMEKLDLTQKRKESVNVSEFLIDSISNGFEQTSSNVPAEEIFDVIYENIILPLGNTNSNMVKLGIMKVSQWQDKEELKSDPSFRLKAFKLLWNHWVIVDKNLSELESEIKRLNKMDGNSVKSRESNIKLEELKNKQKQILEQLDRVDGQALLEELKENQKQISELKSRAGISKIYEKIFTGAINNDDAIKYFLTEDLNKTKILIEARETIIDFKISLNDTIVKLKNVLNLITGDMLEIKGIEDVVSKQKKDLKAKLYELQLAQKELSTREQDICKHIELKIENGYKVSIKEYEHTYDAMQNKKEQLINQELAVRKTKDTFTPLLTKWVTDLKSEDISLNGRDEMYTHYKSICNLVATTCSTKKKLLDELSPFDVVIVDEVSKATPPELMLSMSMGRKTILVGDHRQLPPLYRGRSWEDVLEEDQITGDGINKDTALTHINFERYEKQITSSLFKAYFENAPDVLKATLFTQYRMHPQIMSIVNCFYEGKLKCGLTDPDGIQKNTPSSAKRLHNYGLKKSDGLPLINNDEHVVWIDSSETPEGKLYYEEKEGTSGTFNSLEAIIAAQLVLEIERDCIEKNKHNEQIAVITFYARQRKCINDKLNAMLKQQGRKKTDMKIHCDINSVEQFQGRERGTVIVSMVRSTRGKLSSRANTGQFERINVAFSRAQNLLIIIGSEKTFAQYEVSMERLDKNEVTKEKVYAQIIEKIKNSGQFWRAGQVLSQKTFEGFSQEAILSVTETRNITKKVKK